MLYQKTYDFSCIPRLLKFAFLRIADCGLRIADCGLRIADCGLRIADCGLRMVQHGRLLQENHNHTLFVVNKKVIQFIPLRFFLLWAHSIFTL